MASTLSIAIVSREYPPFFGGGIGSYARWIVPALADAGVRVHVITEAHDSLCPRVELEGPVTVHRVPIAIGRGGWTNAAMRFAINAGKTAARLARTGRIDLVEFAECEGAGAALLLLRRAQCHVPTIVQLHTPSEQLFMLRSLSSQRIDDALKAYILTERLAMRLADGILAPSHFIADWAEKHYRFQTPPTVIPYATGPLPPVPPPPSDKDPSHAKTVLYSGRIEPRKGVESLIHAWIQLAERHNATLVLAGADTSGAPDGGSMRAYLGEMLPEAIRSRVRFLGRLSPALLREEIARADLCIIPSLWENFPNTCIEAMSAAKPVLVGNAGGMREMIGDTIAGETFIAGDTADLARALDEMLSEQKSQLAARGQAARARIEHMCNPERIARARIQHAQALVRSARNPSATRPQGALAEWRAIERSLSGHHTPIGLPTLDPVIAPWVDRAGATA